MPAIHFKLFSFSQQTPPDSQISVSYLRIHALLIKNQMRQNLCCLVVFLRITLFLCSFRVQYARWKEECRQLFPLVGSGRFITAPVVSEEGQRIQDPLVLSETNVENGISDQNAMVDSRTNASSELGVVKDKKVIQWMLTLHQIGRCHLLFQCNFSFCLERFTR